MLLSDSILTMLGPESEEIRAYLRAAQSGSSAALGQLLEAMRVPLLEVAGHQLGTSIRGKVGASDLVQESLIAAALGFPQFRGKTLGEFRGWIAQILEHRAIDLARKFRAQSRDVSREQTNGHLIVESIEDFDHDAQEVMVRRENFRRFMAALDKLSLEDQQLIHWRYREEFSFEKIAQKLSLPRETVRRRWYRIIERIGHYCEDHS